MKWRGKTALASILFLLFGAGDLLAAEVVIIRPESAPGPLDNPFKGWCPYTDAGKIHQPYSMVFLYVPWSELEPSSGEYRFDEWEESWNVEAAKGKHIIFRVYVDYPSLPSGLPSWLRKAGVKETPYKEHGGGRSPDYNDPRMVAAMERLIEALGRRYNNHPRIAFIQLGLLGFWGEWHTWPREEMYASPQTETRMIEAYRKAFPNKSLMVRYARGFAGRQAWLGFHDDMFPEDTDNGEDWSFLAGLRSSGRTDNWQRAVVGGEMTPNKARRWLGSEYRTTMSMLQRAHFTWVGPYCPPLERTRTAEFRERSEALVRKMGYEFQITELRHPAQARPKESIEVSLRGLNNGVAPFYYPWSVKWALLDSKGSLVASQKAGWDIRNWRPGVIEEKTRVAFDIPPGEYQLALGIVDPWRKRPAIKFANRLPLERGWTVLSRLKISR